MDIVLGLCLNTVMESDQINGFQTWVPCRTLCIPTAWSSEQGFFSVFFLSVTQLTNNGLELEAKLSSTRALLLYDVCLSPKYQRTVSFIILAHMLPLLQCLTVPDINLGCLYIPTQESLLRNTLPFLLPLI